jgi:hypothetical protein
MGYQQNAPAPGAPPMEPAEVQSIKTFLHLVRLLALIFGILILIGGVIYAGLAIAAYDACTSVIGNYCGAGLGFLLIWPVLLVIFGVIDFVIWIEMKDIERLVDQRQYEAAKSKTFLWMILGFILGGVITGVLLLVTYLKFDPVINWARGQGQVPAMYAPPPMGQPMAAPVAAAPPPASVAPAAPPPPVAAPAPPPAPFCSKCGKPTTYIPQYGRYYCYDDKLYV